MENPNQPMNRRSALRTLAFSLTPGLLGVAALAGGCGRGGGVNGGSGALAEAADTTVLTLRDLLLGVPPERQGTAATRPDPPLLSPGGYEEVVIAADAENFARLSNGTVPARMVRDLQVQVVRRLNRDLTKRGFRATGAAFDTPAGASALPSGKSAATTGSGKTLLATLAPVTEPAGSPAERARGRAILLVRLTITDPATPGKTLVRRDYYSGRDVGGTGRRERR